jgi:putative hydrolase of the HAD superfamily
MNLNWILFDLGGVLYEIDLHQPIHMLKSLSRANLDGFTEDYLFSEHRKFMKGLYSPENFFNELKKTLNLAISSEEIREIWDNIIVGFRSEFKPLLTGLKLNHKIAIVSNTDPSHVEKVLAQVPEFPYFFNKIFFSYELKTVKPERAFFTKVLKELDEKPEQCLFLDDSEENIETAKLLGFHAERVTSYADVVGVLQFYGIKIYL